MKAGQGKNKGSEFERVVGYKLSLWLSKGERKDLFCRTVGSGAQFTFAQSRDKLAGIPGDLRSQHPLADNFCNRFVIECKHWRDLQVIDFLRGEGELYKALVKVKEEGAKLEKGFMLIARQNFKPILLFTDLYVHVPRHSLFNESVFMYEFDDFLKLNCISDESIEGKVVFE